MLIVLFVWTAPVFRRSDFLNLQPKFIKMYSQENCYKAF